LIMSEARQRQVAARLKQRLGGGPFDLYFFPLMSIKLPETPADLPLAMWKLQIGLETLERRERGELFCLSCDKPIALTIPWLVGFIRSDDPNSELCGFALCESCVDTAESHEELESLIGAAFGCVLAPRPRPN
jgi:hypothetical protein